MARLLTSLQFLAASSVHACLDAHTSRCACLCRISFRSVSSGGDSVASPDSLLLRRAQKWACRSFSSGFTEFGIFRDRVITHTNVEDIRRRILPGYAVRRSGLSNVVGKEPLFRILAPCYLRGIHSSNVINTAQQSVNSAANPLADSPAIASEVQNHSNQLPDTVEMFQNVFNFIVEAPLAVASWTLDQVHTLMALIPDWLDLSSYPTITALQAGFATTAAALAWLVMPRLFRTFHKYVEQGPTARLLRRTGQEQVPYELSFWSALEGPARTFITVIAFCQLGALVAPNMTAAQYFGQISRGAAVITFVWFLYYWKSNAFSRIFAGQALEGVERERYLALDKISSVGLLVLGGMSLAETCGVAVQSILTVGGIGGVATAFAARDVLGNMLSGFSIQFAKPFSIGDTIKAGSVEGQVLEIGLTSTHLLNSDKFPVIVPNSFFSSQVIVNKSRAPWRAFSLKIPVQLKDYEKITQITKDVQFMLMRHPHVHVDKETPCCIISRIDFSYIEVTVSCNIKPMEKNEILSTEQDITLEAIRIMSQSGATLGAVTGT